jgi:hypothetical protein
VIAATLVACACREAAEPAPPPRPLPEEPAALVETLLEYCHGPLQGGLGSVCIELREHAGDEPTLVALDGLRLRADGPDRSVLLAVRDRAWRCPPSSPPMALEGAEREQALALRDLLSAAYLAPLYGKERVTRQGPTVLAVQARAGATWRLEYDPDARLPRSLGGPCGVVVFEEFNDTGAARLPRRVRLGDLGVRHLQLRATDLVFEDYTFRDPAGAAEAAPRPRRLQREAAADAKPTAPRIEVIESAMFLVIDDPESWAERAAAIGAHGAALGEQGQVGEPLPFLFEEGGVRRIGIPFVPGEHSGFRPFVARDGQVVRRAKRHRAAVVFIDKGRIEHALERGPKLLADFVAAEGIAAAGPLRTIPYLAWERGAPDSARLARVAVRFELPLGDAASPK